MSATIHPTAVVDDGASLDDSVRIGPFCHVGAGVELGPETELVSHVTILGPTRMGVRNRVFPYAAIGTPPQDRSYDGEATRVVIGDDNEIREQVTIHRGTVKGGGNTRIGSRCLLMVGAHIAHDCAIGDDVTLANLASLAGHVSIAEGSVFGGHVAVAPFTRIGRYSFLAGGARVERDVPPFVTVAGDRARVRALNTVGLRRNGVPEASREMLVRAFRAIYASSGTRAEGRKVAADEWGTDPYVSELLEFLAEGEEKR